MTTNRFFTEAEVKEAENILNILAMFSAKFWAETIISDCFLCCTNITGKDYIDRDKYYCIENAEEIPISGKQIMLFMSYYYNFAAEEIKRLLASDEYVAKVLGISVCESRTKEGFGDVEGKKYLFLNQTRYGSTSFSFGGVDNDPWGPVAKALAKADIPGIFIGRTKTQIVLRERKIRLWRLGYDEVFMEL